MVVGRVDLVWAGVLLSMSCHVMPVSRKVDFRRLI